MSVFAYNGVTLPYPHTTSFRQEAVYDDVSQTDRFLTRIEIQLECVLNTDYMETIDPTLTNLVREGSAANVMTVIRDKLLKERKQLTFTFNGFSVIPPQQTGNRGPCDAKNGPQPQSCTVLQLTNSTFFMVYHIVAHYWANLSYVPGATLEDFPTVTNKASNNVLFNRWSETVEIDNCEYSRRTREGKYVIRSDNVDGKTADQIRVDMAVTGVPKGFLRESSRYTVSPDGLGLSYTIVDKEVFRMPPSPAFEAEGYYQESTPRGDAKRIAECMVRLRGAKTTNPAELIRTAMIVCTSKLRIQGLTFTGGTVPMPPGAVGPAAPLAPAIPLAAMVRMPLYDNSVEVHVTAMFGASAAKFAGIAAISKNFPTVPLSTHTQPVVSYRDRGTASILLQAAAYYDPSLRRTKLDRDKNQMTAGLAVGTAGKLGES